MANQSILIISCTNRKNSLTQKISEYYQKRLDAFQVSNQILDLAILPNDFITTALYENSGKNNEFNAFQKLIDEHQRFILVVPEYNGSFPGVLKAFMDGLRYPDSWKDKKIGLVGLSSGTQGGILALSHLTDIFHYLNAEVLSIKVKLAQIHQYFKDKQLHNDLYNELIDLQIKKIQTF